MPDQTATPDTAAASAETASWIRRMAALAIDWFACTLVVMLVIGPGGWSEDPQAGFYTLLVYVTESTLLTATVGGSFGKLATRLRVVRVDGSGRPLGIFPALLRQVMIALVIPPLVFKPDGRGLHDVVVGTATVPLSSHA